MSGRNQDECRGSAERPPLAPPSQGGEPAIPPPLRRGGWGGRLQASLSSPTPNSHRQTITAALAFALVLSSSSLLPAKTITLTELDTERMAAISSLAPMLSWAGTHHGHGEFANHYIELYSTSSLLMQFPLDKIPAGQRIVKAEWIVPVPYVYPRGEHKVTIHRLIGDWGTGVCQDFRMTHPKKVPWDKPGARGSATDRAARPTANVTMTQGAGRDHAINVTQDVELWYSGQVPNQGWIMTIDEPNVLIRISSPFWGSHGNFKLRITYEPE